ncbi:MAG: T9SS type A sorting domain-containing protein [Paludibacter sp.]
MKPQFFRLLVGMTAIFYSVNSFAQAILNADEPGNTYELINSILAPGATAEETPDQFDPAFGRHIAEVWDADLNQYVFEFYLHVSVANEHQDESTGDTDRQRVEIKTYAASPNNLKGVPGETITYKWKFKIPSGFQPSSNFTHIHQIKAVGGDDSDPIFTLTCRKGTPNKLELNYYSNSNLSSIKFASADLSLFENAWVEATERIKIDSIHGSYSINIVKVSDGTKLLLYSNNDLLTYRATNTFIRPKWGIYRSLLSVQDLRDETLRFNSFSIFETPTKVDSDIANSENNFKVVLSPGGNKLFFEYYLPDKLNVEIAAYSLNGQKIKSIFNKKNQESGFYQNSADISVLKTGVYIIRMQSGNYSQKCKLIIRKN